MRNLKVKNMALCALFASLMTICAWLHVPTGNVAVTMQTFGLFLALGLLGGKGGTAAIFVYLLLGAVGLPVFSGFQGGFGVFLGPAGGYLWGFLACAGVYWLITAGKNTAKRQLLAMILGLCVCYLLEILWFSGVYLNGTAVGLGAVLLNCVVPYLVPDGIKLALAFFLSQKLRRFV